MGRTHLAITVKLVHGPHTGDLWPRPGRVLIVSRSATFEHLAAAIDGAFARWDRSHLHEFTLTDSTVITPHAGGTARNQTDRWTGPRPGSAGCG